MPLRTPARSTSSFSPSASSSPGSRPRRALSSPPSRTSVPIPVYIERFLIDNSYTFLKPLTQNKYAIFVAARHNASGETCGITKVINIGTNTFLAKRALRQIRILKHARAHKNIICMYDLDVVLDAQSDFQDVYIYTELMQNSLHMLLSTLHSPNPSSRTPLLSVQHTRYLTYQLLCALKYLDSAGVVHGNIHPHTILVNADSTLKIALFADAKPGINKETLRASYSPIHDGSGIDAWVKSPQEHVEDGRRALEVRMGDRSMVWYNSPEVLLGCPQKLSTTSDTWSAGCILGEMLGGSALFPGDDSSKVIQVILGRLGSPAPDVLPRIAPPLEYPKFTSTPPRKSVPFEIHNAAAEAPLSLDLLSKLLHWDPTVRLSAAEALEHPWFVGWRDSKDEGICERRYDFSSEAIEDLERIKDRIVDEIEHFRVGVRVEAEQLMTSPTPLDILTNSGGGLIVPQGHGNPGIRERYVNAERGRQTGRMHPNSPEQLNRLGVIAFQNDLTITMGGVDTQSDMDADGESDWE